MLDLRPNHRVADSVPDRGTEHGVLVAELGGAVRLCEPRPGPVQKGDPPVEIDRVALAVGWRPRGEPLAESISGAVAEVVIIGDALKASDFVAAINAGADAGLAV